MQLGSEETLDTVGLDKPLFLEIVFGEGAEVLAPRVPITAVPYSLRAKSLDDGALVAGDNVSIERQGDVLRISAAGGDSGPTSTLSAPHGNPAAAVVVDNEGRMGIGTTVGTTPAPLHIRRERIALPATAIRDRGLVVQAT